MGLEVRHQAEPVISPTLNSEEADFSAVAYVTTEMACKSLGVTDQTLRRWAKVGLIKWYRVTDAGHRHYDVDGLLEREQRRLDEKRARLAART